MPTVIRAAGAAEFLALLPVMLGYEPRNSVVAVALRAGRTCGAMRYDVPTGDPAALAMTIVGVACRIDGADAVIPAVYTDQQYRVAAKGAPGDVLGCLVQNLTEAGFVIPDAFMVADDGWALAGEVDGGLVLPPYPEANEHLARAGTLRSTHPIDDGPATAAVLAPRERQFADAVRRAAERMRHSELGTTAQHTGVSMPDVSKVTCALTDAERGRPSAAQVALLGQLCGHPASRDAVLVRIALGLRASADTFDDPVTFSILITGGDGVRLDFARLERAHEALRFAIPHLPRAQRPAPLTIAAWLCWAQGRGSAAIAHIGRALTIDPAYRLALMLREYVCAGHIPEWAFEARHATEPVRVEPEPGTA